MISNVKKFCEDIWEVKYIMNHVGKNKRLYNHNNNDLNLP